MIVVIISSSNIIIVVVAVVVSGANVLQTASCTFLESDPFLGPEVPEARGTLIRDRQKFS